MHKGASEWPSVITKRRKELTLVVWGASCNQTWCQYSSVRSVPAHHTGSSVGWGHSLLSCDPHALEVWPVSLWCGSDQSCWERKDCWVHNSLLSFLHTSLSPIQQNHCVAECMSPNEQFSCMGCLQQCTEHLEMICTYLSTLYSTLPLPLSQMNHNCHTGKSHPSEVLRRFLYIYFYSRTCSSVMRESLQHPHYVNSIIALDWFLKGKASPYK